MTTFTSLLIMIGGILFAVILLYIMFFNSSKEKNIKQLEIPTEYKFEVLELINKAAIKEPKDHKAHYYLWNTINEIFPETKVGHWRWCQHGTQLFVIQTNKRSIL